MKTIDQMFFHLQLVSRPHKRMMTREEALVEILPDKDNYNLSDLSEESLEEEMSDEYHIFVSKIPVQRTQPGPTIKPTL